MTLREDALHASYRRRERPLYNVLYRQLWQAEDCQDVIHDTYLRLWARRARVREATLDALVWRTALNLARNRLRWRRLRRHEPLPALPAAEEGADPLAVQRLHAALKALPGTSREVLLLARFGGLTGREIAAALGIRPGTVASRTHHAMARLRQLLGEAGHE